LIARGIWVFGLVVSSPRAAAPSKPAKARKPYTAALAIVPTPLPEGSDRKFTVNVWPCGPWLKMTVAKMTTLRIVTRIAPITSEVSSARVMIRISAKANALTPMRPISAIHHHCWVERIPVSLRNWPPNRPISIVEPQPMAM
jgi:hypothetical protein